MERPCDAGTANEHFLCEVAQQFFAKRAAHLHSDKLSKNGIRMTPMNMMLAGARGPAWKRMFCDFASRAHAAECLQDSLMYTLAACTMHFVDNNLWEVLRDKILRCVPGIGEFVETLDVTVFALRALCRGQCTRKELENAISALAQTPWPTIRRTREIPQRPHLVHSRGACGALAKMYETRGDCSVDLHRAAGDVLNGLLHRRLCAGEAITHAHIGLCGARLPLEARRVPVVIIPLHAEGCYHDVAAYSTKLVRVRLFVPYGYALILDCPCGASGGVGADRLCAIADVELGHGGRDPVDIKLPRVEQLARLTNIACEPSEHSPDIKNVGVGTKFSVQ